MTALPLATVREIEETSFNAMPTLATQIHDGWIARYADGVTGRANSVNALAPGATPVDDIAALFEPLYASRGLPCRFRVTPLCPPETADVLAARGYRRDDEVSTEWVTLRSEWSVDPGIVLAPMSDASWRAAYAAAAGRFDERERAVLARMHAAILPAKTFASIRDGDTILATGFAVAEGPWMSIHEITTAPRSRRAGLGRRMVTSLLAWGRTQGATRCWLQVTSTNTPARTLYRALGFTEAYRYTYWLTR